MDIFCFKAHDQWHDHPIHPRLDIPINATYISPSALGFGIFRSSLKCLQNIREKSDASVKSHVEMSAEHLGKSGATVKPNVSLDPRRQNSPVDAT